MKIREIKFNNSVNKYSLFLDHDILSILPTKKIALVMDANVP